MWAQDCTPENITLTSQGDVDDFQKNHGPCDKAGNLSVTGADIVNLDGLANLIGVEDLRIESNDVLANIDGLANLTSVGSNLVIRSNAALQNVDGLANLTSVGWALAIISNSALTDIDGLANLTSVGSVLISGNKALTSIDGLANLSDFVPIFDFAQDFDQGVCRHDFEVW